MSCLRTWLLECRLDYIISIRFSDLLRSRRRRSTIYGAGCVCKCTLSDLGLRSIRIDIHACVRYTTRVHYYARTPADTSVLRQPRLTRECSSTCFSTQTNARCSHPHSVAKQQQQMASSLRPWWVLKKKQESRHTRSENRLLL